MNRQLLSLLLPLSLNAACAQDAPSNPRAEFRRLVNIGRYEEAEAVARQGGAAFAVLLGDVLVARGRLAAADSAYQRATTASAADRTMAAVSLAELAQRRGDHSEAARRAQAIVRGYENVRAPSSDESLAAGRAFVVLMDGDAEAPRRALAALDMAMAADSTNIDALRRVGDLFLLKYDAPKARESFQTVLRLVPADSKALLGLARIEEFEGKPTAMDAAQKSLAANARLADALVLVSRLHLDAELYDSASTYGKRALAVDSASMSAWAMLGAIAWIEGDSSAFRQARTAATRLQPRPSDFYAELADAAVRHRRYAEAVQLAQQAVNYDSVSVHALGVLGTTQLRIGQMQQGRQALERAFALDPFNLWHKNTLDLLDKMKGFRTIDDGIIRIVAPAEEAELLALYVVPLLKQAFEELATRYAYRPPTPIRLEFFRQHADFSVRGVGLTGLGALGVSFGSVLAMDTPNARDRGTFNWGSTAWHELTHAFTLGASAHRVPRWLSEGMSVLEERRTNRGWGADATPLFIGALAGNVLHPMSRLSDGFVRPRFPSEISFSYYQASLFCEMVEELKGAKALPAMLVAYREGLETPAVMQKVLGLNTAQVDEKFDLWMRARLAVPLRAFSSNDGKSEPSGQFVTLMQRALPLATGNRAQRDSALLLLEQARALFPTYGGEDGPNWYLAVLARERGDSASAINNLAQLTSRNETAWDANVLEATLRERRGDDAGAMAALERLIWIYPYETDVHVRLATLAEKRRDFALGVRERRAVVATRPADLADARYELARALAAAGDIAAARRELLSVLEEAPSFEKAQLLLLELRNKGTPGGRQ